MTPTKNPTPPLSLEEGPRIFRDLALLYILGGYAGLNLFLLLISPYGQERKADSDTFAHLNLESVRLASTGIDMLCRIVLNLDGTTKC